MKNRKSICLDFLRKVPRTISCTPLFGLCGQGFTRSADAGDSVCGPSASMR